MKTLLAAVVGAALLLTASPAFATESSPASTSSPALASEFIAWTMSDRSTAERPFSDPQTDPVRVADLSATPPCGIKWQIDHYTITEDEQTLVNVTKVLRGASDDSAFLIGHDYRFATGEDCVTDTPTPTPPVTTPSPTPTPTVTTSFPSHLPPATHTTVTQSLAPATSTHIAVVIKPSVSASSKPVLRRAQVLRAAPAAKTGQLASTGQDRGRLTVLATVASLLIIAGFAASLLGRKPKRMH